MKNKALYILVALLTISMWACKNKSATTGEQSKVDSTSNTNSTVVFKGLYSGSPAVKSFKECGHQNEYWVADSSAQLELQYAQLNLKPEEPVYVQVEGKKIKTKKDGVGGGFDSTLVVTKLIKITKEIPKDICN